MKCIGILFILIFFFFVDALGLSFHGILSRTVPITYSLVEQSGESLGGSFYRPELLKVKKDLKKEEFHIEKIWEYKKEGRYKYALVSFKGYKGKEWVPVRDLVGV